MSKLPDNPFRVSGYQGPSTFCDRVEETRILKQSLLGHRNITLTSLRRMGKSALIHHVFQQIRDERGATTFYVDLLPTRSIQEFISIFATAVARSTSETSQTGSKVWSWIKRLRPVITYDPYSGLPQVSVDVGRTEEQQASIAGLLDTLDRMRQPVVIALDEFQQILTYPDTTIESWLRSHIQRLSNITFVFSGSSQHMLAEMFQSSKRPFYGSAGFLKLNPISENEYVSFIQEHMQSGGKRIDEEDVRWLLTWCRHHTWYVQTMFNRLYHHPEKVITRDVILADINAILTENEPVYHTYRSMLTSAQWTLLQAIANEERLLHPTASAFIERYSLNSPAAVKRGLDSLLDKELIYREFDADGVPYIQVYDVFLSRWLMR